jgi:hypothetical protein
VTIATWSLSFIDRFRFGHDRPLILTVQLQHKYLISRWNVSESCYRVANARSGV